MLFIVSYNASIPAVQKLKIFLSYLLAKTLKKIVIKDPIIKYKTILVKAIFIVFSNIVILSKLLISN
jgi:hypothetical protein